MFDSLVRQASEAIKRGLSIEDTKKTLDLETFRARLAGDDAVRKGMFADSILRSAVEDAYKALASGLR